VGSGALNWRCTYRVQTKQGAPGRFCGVVYCYREEVDQPAETVDDPANNRLTGSKPGARVTAKVCVFEPLCGAPTLVTEAIDPAGAAHSDMVGPRVLCAAQIDLAACADGDNVLALVF